MITTFPSQFIFVTFFSSFLQEMSVIDYSYQGLRKRASLPLFHKVSRDKNVCIGFGVLQNLIICLKN